MASDAIGSSMENLKCEMGQNLPGKLLPASHGTVLGNVSVTLDHHQPYFPTKPTVHRAVLRTT